MKIGFIGLGNMGGPMALNLIKAGHTLVVHDVRRPAAAPHLERGATWAESPRAAAHGNELILTSLPGPTEVEAVALGADGIIHGAVPGSVYADLSTGSPTVMRKIHAAFKDKGVHVLDAPVSGGVWGAQRGTLQVMVGGDESIYREVKDVLGAVGDKVGYMGPIGAGTVAKLVHNMIGIATRAHLRRRVHARRQGRGAGPRRCSRPSGAPPSARACCSRRCFPMSSSRATSTTCGSR